MLSEGTAFRLNLWSYFVMATQKKQEQRQTMTVRDVLMLTNLANFFN